MQETLSNYYGNLDQIDDVMDFLNIGIISIDLDDHINAVNQTALNLFNISKKQAIKADFQDLCDQWQLNLPIFKEKNAILEGKIIKNFEYSLSKDSDCSHKLNWSFIRRINKEREPIGILILIQDITEKKQLQKERDYLDNIIANLPGNVYWKNREGVYLGCNINEAHHSNFQTREEMVGKTVYDIDPKKYADPVDHLDNEIMLTGIAQIAEELGADERVYLSHKKPLKDQQGNIIGLLGVSFDITDRKKMEEELKAAKERLAAIDRANIEALAYMVQKITGQEVDQEKSPEQYAQMMCDYYENLIAVMPGNVYWMNREGVYLGCNNNCAKYVGLVFRPNIIGKTVHSLFEYEDAVQLDRIDKEVMKRNQPKFLEEQTNPNKPEEIYLTHKVPLHNSSGKVIGLLGISFDITERKKQEAQLQEAKIKERAQAARIKTLETVGVSIAHELRTPLEAINLQAQGLQTFLPDLLQGYHLAQESLVINAPYIQSRHLKLLDGVLNAIHEETRFAKTIIDMFLMNIQMDRADVEDFGICSMVTCIDEALKRYPMSPKERLLIHWDRKHDFKIQSHELWVIHMLFNLLKNAFYYIAKAEKGEITIWLEPGSKWNRLYFKDTGAGIPAKNLARVFDHFFSQTHGGTGIGLAFCKRAMQNLKGSIDCHSQEDKFTEFVLSFPKV
ncbi:MAG: PAS domain-containing protein [Gammaproteobacteria bacterium]|nr:PAS domain-containing protein [Gammaproteobacteria bacterium]